jgi:outer membrane lipase/esterase
MRQFFAGLLALLASLPATAWAYSDIVFFGDSLTDTGNVTTLYATLPKPPGAPAVIPGPPYDPEGRASNGLLYADVLARGLGFDALASERGGNNFAFGGARTRYQLFGRPFLGIEDQVDAFTARSPVADANALYVVWGGSNNLQDIFLRRTTDALGNPIPDVAGTLQDIGGVLQELYAHGARHLLVPNVPDLGLVPRVRELGGAPGQALATALVTRYNTGLSSLLDQFALTHPDADVHRFDSFSFLDRIVADAASLGFTNTTDRCYTGDDTGFTGGGTVCADPNAYVFWDGIHPTTHVHQLLGEAMLSAVPEPSSTALMALGLLAVAVLVRRRGRDFQPLRRICHGSA